MALKLDNSIPKDPYTKQLCPVDILIFGYFKKERSVNNALVIVHLFMIFLCIVAPLKDQARRRRTQACSQGKLPTHRLS